MLNIPYLRELCENAPPFVISAAAREALPELLDRVEALEWLLEVKEVTWADMDAMSMEGFREFREIRKKALRDAGEE